MPYSIWCSMFAAAALLVFALIIWANRWPQPRYAYSRGREVVILFIVIYAIVALVRFFAYGPVPKEELLGHLIFWAVLPPLWFFVEFYAFDTGWITDLNPDSVKRQDEIKRVKDYADFASKIWAGVGAALVGLASLWTKVQ